MSKANKTHEARISTIEADIADIKALLYKALNPPMPELPKMAVTTVPEPKPKAPSDKLPDGFTLTKYKDTPKGTVYILTGDTKPIKEKLKELTNRKTRWNRDAEGWTLVDSDLPAVKKFLATL